MGQFLAVVLPNSIMLCFNVVKLLALALTNLVLDLANLVTNLAKPSLVQPSH